METAVGVFASHERAEEAVRRLLEHGIPEDRILYLTRSENDANHIGRQLGVHEGGARSVDKIAADSAHLAIPGVGPVFALGPGAAALFGLAGPERDRPPAGGSLERQASAPAEGGASEDFAFFRRILNDGHSVIVVRTASSKIAAAASEILNDLGFSMKKGAAPKSSVNFRQVPGAVVAELVGKIAFAGGAGLLRETVQSCLERGQNRILLDLGRVDFIDSAGLGELVRSHAAVRSRGGQLKLVKPSEGVHQLLRLTKLDRVFEIAPDEYSALHSLRDDRRPG
jgi:anti-sigma B factor antagonist